MKFPVIQPDRTATFEPWRLTAYANHKVIGRRVDGEILRRQWMVAGIGLALLGNLMVFGAWYHDRMTPVPGSTFEEKVYSGKSVIHIGQAVTPAQALLMLKMAKHPKGARK